MPETILLLYQTHSSDRPTFRSVTQLSHQLIETPSHQRQRFQEQAPSLDVCAHQKGLPRPVSPWPPVAHHTQYTSSMGQFREHINQGGKEQHSSFPILFLLIQIPSPICHSRFYVENTHTIRLQYLNTFFDTNRATRQAQCVMRNVNGLHQSLAVSQAAMRLLK
jgi:hypothetical protein